MENTDVAQWTEIRALPKIEYVVLLKRTLLRGTDPVEGYELYLKSESSREIKLSRS
jgi:hypothetical protein